MCWLGTMGNEPTKFSDYPTQNWEEWRPSDISSLRDENISWFYKLGSFFNRPAYFSHRMNFSRADGGGSDSVAILYIFVPLNLLFRDGESFKISLD